MWDFMNCVDVEHANPYWASKWDEECKEMEDQGYTLIYHHFENKFSDEDAEVSTFSRLVVREIASKTLYIYGMDDIQQANADYPSRKWFSTVAQMV